MPEPADVAEWMGRMGRRWGGNLAAVVAAAAAKRLYGPERECDADLYALRLWIKAGYHPERCLRFFLILENHFLNRGDVNAVVGGAAESDEELEASVPGLTRLCVWAYRRRRGYLSIRDRLFTFRKAAGLA